MATGSIDRWSDDFVCNYTQKDLILYALATGFEELEYVFEKDPHFKATPSFCFALWCWASKKDQNSNSDTTTSTAHVQDFPTPMMRENGLIPKECLREQVDFGLYPVIHM